MAVTLDMMEYANDGAAQAAYPTNGHHAATFVATAELDTAFKKWGTASLLLDGDSDYIWFADSPDWDVVADKNDDWTIELQVRHTDHALGEPYLAQMEAGTDFWMFYHEHGQGIRFYYNSGGVNRLNLVGGEIIDSNWHHVVLCKVGNQYGIYKGGIQVAHGTTDIEDTFAAQLYIGFDSVFTRYFDGHKDEVRIVHGNPYGAAPVVGLTDTITPPTAPHQTDTNTKLLLHLDGADEAQATLDWSRLESRSDDTIEQQGDYCLEGFAKQTDSLNDTLTRTVDPMIDLSGIDEAYFYIWSSRTGAHIKVGIHDAGGTTTEKTYTITQANTWELVTWDISGVADGDKDAIDSIIITISNADADNTFYLDYFYGAEDMVLALEENLALLESMTAIYPTIVLLENLALLESLPTLEHGLTLTELLALLESETADVTSLLTESVALLESLPGLDRDLTLTESLVLLEDLTDALWDDASWEAFLSAQLVKDAIIYFEHKGVNYSSYLADVATIKRSAELTSGIATCVLSNIGQIWNLFLDDKTEIGSLAEVGIKASPALGFTNRVELFTGKVDDVAYIDAEATLRLRDKLVSTLEKRLGNGENPVEYLTPQNPADLAWELLVTQGGLDNTASTANTDIDYTSWSSWKADCTTLKYSLKARFTGHYITSGLMMIADQTDSYVWMGGDGKFYFKRPIPPFAPGGTLPEYGRDDCLQIDASLTKENLINSYRVRYGWELDIQDWDGSYLAEDETSKSEYGTYPGVEEDKVVWHADLDSATEHGDRVVDKNKQPLTKIIITSTLKGIFLSLGDTILVTEVLKNFFPIYARVVNIENIDITKGLVRFACRDISDEQIAAFVLDDIYWGKLDQDYNRML